jgi:hypothetical protein
MSDDDDDDESSFFSFITPLNLFVTSAVLLLIIYIAYEKFHENSSVSTWYICFAIIGIFIGIFLIKWFGRWASFIEWGISLVLTLGTAWFYYQFLL